MLILDTARFKYPPHWVPLEMLYRWGRLAGGHAWQPLRLRAGAVLALLAAGPLAPHGSGPGLGGAPHVPCRPGAALPGRPRLPDTALTVGGTGPAVTRACRPPAL